MFAYCGNNPVCNVDYSGDRYCEATTVSSESCEERGISCRWQTYIKIENPTPLDKAKLIGVKFVPDSFGNGGKIVNSYKISDGFKMTEYAMYLMYESAYSSYFSGSVEGFVFEWDVHNVAYRVYNDLGNVTKANSAKDLDVGRTIYADNHGFMTYAMLRLYELMYPAQARKDLFIHNGLTN